MRPRFPILLALVLTAASAHAGDALSGLRARLKHPGAVQPLSAQIDATATTHADKDRPPTQARVGIAARSDADGLGLRYPPALLQRAAREARAHPGDRGAPRPVANLLTRLDAVTVQGMMDYGPHLLELLDGARLVGERNEKLDGGPTHLLEFDLPMPPDLGKQLTIKDYSGRLQVWLGADGVPVAARQMLRVKARKFLIGIRFDTTTRWSLKQVGNRIVAVTMQQTESHAVLGEDGDSRLDVRLTPEAQPAMP